MQGLPSCLHAQRCMQLCSKRDWAYSFKCHQDKEFPIIPIPSFNLLVSTVEPIQFGNRKTTFKQSYVDMMLS